MQFQMNYGFRSPAATSWNAMAPSHHHPSSSLLYSSSSSSLFITSA